MTAEVTTLANGLRIVTDTMPHIETVSLGIWVASGARHETAAEHGLSHLLEHMAFKGTASRSAKDIAEEIEAIGGDLNAATGTDTTAYFARVLKGGEETAVDLLADILLDARYAEDELVREQRVILQEIAALADNPEDIAHDLFQDAAFPGQPLGRPVIGTKETVIGFTVADLKALSQAFHRPQQMIVSAAGALQHAPFVRLVAARFGGLTSGESRTASPARYVGGQRASGRKFEQSHLLLGFEAPPLGDASYYAAQVASGMLGGGMSSRLFQEVRERRGLCYSVYASVWGLEDSGMLAIHAATAAAAMPALMDVIGTELHRMAAERPSDAETARAKAQLKAGLMMALESSGARTEQMARQLILFDRLIPAAELAARVEAVAPEDVRNAAERILATPPSVVVVGAGRRSHGHAARALRLISC